MRYRFLLTIMLVFTGMLSAQRDITKDALGTSMIDFHYIFQVPSQDMAERFGVNSALGAGYAFKTKSNWIVGIEMNYMFSQNVKNSDSLLYDLEVHPGEFIISNNGGSAEIRLHERGVNGFVKFGKVFPVLSPNPNSGFFATVGIGYMGYKIRIDNVASQALIFANGPEGYNDYIKGYDRLTGGFAISENIGYLFFEQFAFMEFLSCRRFYAGIYQKQTQIRFRPSRLYRPRNSP
jgi:hypothetical protein